VFPAPSRGGLYVGRVIVGRYESGAVKYAQRSAATVEELRTALEDVKPSAEGTTVGQWLDRWLREMKCKIGTRRNRVSLVTHHIKPSIGHLSVATVTPRQIEVAAAGWNLAPSSARNAVAILGTALRAAVRDQLRPDNPVRSALKPKVAKKKLDPFTLDEIERITQEAARRPHTRAIALLAVTGMRTGEALALDVTDFDPAARVLKITKTLDNCDRELRGTPKSPNSAREIEVPTDPLDGLAALQAARGDRAHGPLFLTGTHRRMVDKVLRSNWLTLLKRLGIRARGKHQLRHAWASHSLAAGVDVAEVAKYIGDTPKVVLETYAHATSTVNAAEAFAGLFRGRRGDAKVTLPARDRAARLKNKSTRRK
jgi:integrase